MEDLLACCGFLWITNLLELAYKKIKCKFMDFWKGSTDLSGPKLSNTRLT